MHILIVEDEDDVIEDLKAVIEALSHNVQIRTAKSRDSACALLDSDFFDFAIFDLKIPTQDGGLDGEPQHGHYVFAHARTRAPGMNILVLTSSPSEDFTATMLQAKELVDIWSEGRKVGTIDFLRKLDFIKAPGIIAPIIGAIEALEEIELNLRDVNLSIEQDRLIRIFAKKFQSGRCVVSSLTPGRSGATPLRLQLFDQAGAPIQTAVAKLGPLAKVQDECTRYDTSVILLNPASTPRKLATLEYGAGATAGIFYGLAEGFDQSLFQVISANDAAAARAVEAVGVALAQWPAGVPESRQTVAKVRQCWLSDESAADLQRAFGLDWAPAYEAEYVQTRWCCVHGDLHGGNILVSPDQLAVLIDYGDVGPSAASFDPLTLELSAVLHPDIEKSAAWPTLEQCRNWANVDIYLDGSPIPLFVRQCRAWAGALAAGDREIAATAYAYLLRQLKYDDTDKERIVALLDGIRAYRAAT
ncbi:MAG: hypothetical protein JWR80_539 [Bradyrhizobium sp.]|nr:hypothetical protein [Bradyrhizobium sp.]